MFRDSYSVQDINLSGSLIGLCEYVNIYIKAK